MYEIPDKPNQQTYKYSSESLLTNYKQTNSINHVNTPNK